MVIFANTESDGGEQGPVQDDHHLPMVSAVLCHSLPQQEGPARGEDHVFTPCGLLPRV